MEHTIPRYNWPLTHRYLTGNGWVEGRHYNITQTTETVIIKFESQIIYERYWDQWGKRV